MSWENIIKRKKFNHALIERLIVSEVDKMKVGDTFASQELSPPINKEYQREMGNETRTITHPHISRILGRLNNVQKKKSGRLRRMTTRGAFVPKGYVYWEV